MGCSSLWKHSGYFLKKRLVTTNRCNGFNGAAHPLCGNKPWNPLWIPRLFNVKSGCVCRNRRYFQLFRYTLVKRCHARGRHTFGKYVQTGSAAKLAANLAYYIIPARQIKPINPKKRPLFLRQFYKSGQNARQSRCSLYRTFTSWWLNSSWTASKISASQPTQAKAKPR